MCSAKKQSAVLPCWHRLKTLKNLIRKGCKHVFHTFKLNLLRKTNKLSQPSPYYAAFLSPAVVRVRAGVSCRSCPALHGSLWPKQPQGPTLSSPQQLAARLEPSPETCEMNPTFCRLRSSTLRWKDTVTAHKELSPFLDLRSQDIIGPVVDNRTTSNNKPFLHCVCWKHSARITHHPHREAWGWRHPAMGMLLCSRSWKACEDWGEIGCSKRLEKSSRKTCCSLLDNSDWLDLFSSKKKGQTSSQSYTEMASKQQSWVLQWQSQTSSQTSIFGSA